MVGKCGSKEQAGFQQLAAENSHLELQAPHRDSKLGMISGFVPSKSTTSDIPSPARARLLNIPRQGH